MTLKYRKEQRREKVSWVSLIKCGVNTKMNITNITEEAHQASLIYNNPIGKTYLYVYNNNQYIEIIFEKDEFKHLTGISTKLNPKDFYKNILKKEDISSTN